MSVTSTTDNGLMSSGDVLIVTPATGWVCRLPRPLWAEQRRWQFDTNVGLRDILAALRWIRDNTAFGGDASRVTLFGELAGGGIVTTMLAVLPQGEVQGGWPRAAGGQSAG